MFCSYIHPTFTCFGFHIQGICFHINSHQFTLLAMTTTFTKVSFMMVLLVVFLTSTAPEAKTVTCGQVVGAIAPCLGYLRNGGNPPPVCCNGMKVMRKRANTTADRRAICNCLKSASSSYRGVNGNYAASLPGKCGINLPYKLSPSTDCNKYDYD
ncbi:hypothetical protein SSX86_022684 [Deinandra increscens subsp. villosa]|uniref:Non-specific lipid-transfer protein n=1 Tax=Deinandra increscens subsp. villosa TaxID=3103831 RepID=A0AAP0CKZ4_9ASTR